MSRRGKIARLPRATRDELNRRLENGESGVRLAQWLNGLPEVRQSLAENFGGRPIREQNLSEWKLGGYLDWQARQETLAQARELAADAGELSEATDGRLTDHLASVLAAWNGEVTEGFRGKLRALRGLCQDIVELRRGDHSGVRLGIEQERLDRERQKTEEEVIEHFKRWVRNPQVRDWICQDRMSDEERERWMREIFGLAPKTPGEAVAAASQTYPVQPNPGKSG